MSITQSILLTAVFSLTAIASSSCHNVINGIGKSVKASGQTETKDYSYSSASVKSLDLATGVNVTFIPADSAKTTTVTVETDKAMMPYVVVELDGTELNIYRKNTVNNGGIAIDVEISGPSVSSWELGSGATLKVTGPLTISGTLDIDTSSGAIAYFNEIQAKKLSVDVSSCSSVAVSGVVAGKLSVDASSGAIAKISGIKGAKVSAEASSGAIVSLAGWASDIDTDASSGGSVRHSDLKLTR